MFDFIPQEYEKLVNIIFLTVTALVAPGPEVTNTTPGFPLDLA